MYKMLICLFLLFFEHEVILLHSHTYNICCLLILAINTVECDLLWNIVKRQLSSFVIGSPF